jgi:hypothetical protein
MRPPFAFSRRWLRRPQDELESLSERQLSPGNIKGGGPAFVPGEHVFGERSIVEAVGIVPEPQPAIERGHSLKKHSSIHDAF